MWRAPRLRSPGPVAGRVGIEPATADPVKRSPPCSPASTGCVGGRPEARGMLPAHVSSIASATGVTTSTSFGFSRPRSCCTRTPTRSRPIREPFADVSGWTFGEIGVVMFFAMSGFLIAKSWSEQPHLCAVRRQARAAPDPGARRGGVRDGLRGRGDLHRPAAQQLLHRSHDVDLLRALLLPDHVLREASGCVPHQPVPGRGERITVDAAGGGVLLRAGGCARQARPAATKQGAPRVRRRARAAA